MILSFNQQMSKQMFQTRGMIEIESENSEETTINKGPSIKVQKDHPIDTVIG